MLFNIQRWSLHDGAGIRTTVFFKGCPLRCRWCSNPESWSFDKQILIDTSRCTHCGECVDQCPSGSLAIRDGQVSRDCESCSSCGTCIDVCPNECFKQLGFISPVSEILDELRRDAVFYRQSGGGVTFSGGEPFAQPDLLRDLVKGCMQLGIGTAVETSGTIPYSQVEDIYALFDEIFVDLKHSHSAVHQQLTGFPNTDVLHTIRQLDKSKYSFTVRIPLIAGLTDTDYNIQGLIEFFHQLDHPVCVELLPYHELGTGKYSSLGYPYDATLSSPDSARIAEILAQLKKHGISAICAETSE